MGKGFSTGYNLLNTLPAYDPTKEGVLLKEANPVLH